MGLPYSNPATNAQMVRRARGLSQDVLAIAAGVPREDYSRYERGFKTPSPSVKARIAEALDLKPEDAMVAP
jgi:transcriptional regulator with XRE-family HTH domain